jgi:hypothetical protein
MQAAMFEWVFHRPKCVLIGRVVYLLRHLDHDWRVLAVAAVSRRPRRAGLGGTKTRLASAH